MDWTNKMIGYGVFYSSLLMFGVIFPGCRSKEDSVGAEKDILLQPNDLVNTCAMVMSENEVKGTGFFARNNGVPDAPVCFVTARHVAERLTNGFAMYPRLILKVKKRDGYDAARVQVPVRRVAGQAYWYQNPRGNADLAVFPVPNYTQITNGGCDIRVIGFSGKGTRDTVGHLSATASPAFRVGEGHETVMLAASPELLRIASANEFLITVRKGAIAAVPRAVLRYHYGPARLIVLDCPVQAGNSGGPVFVWIREMAEGRTGAEKVPKLLGVVSSMLQDRMIALPNENRIFLENSGLSLITPSDEVAETLRYLESANRSR